MSLLRLRGLATTLLATATLLLSLQARAALETSGLYTFGAFRFADDAVVKRLQRDVCAEKPAALPPAAPSETCYGVRVFGAHPTRLKSFIPTALVSGHFTNPGRKQYVFADDFVIDDRPVFRSTLHEGTMLLLVEAEMNGSLHAIAFARAIDGASLSNCEVIRLGRRDALACGWSRGHSQHGGERDAIAALTLIRFYPGGFVEWKPLLVAPPLDDNHNLDAALCRRLPFLAASLVALWQTDGRAGRSSVVAYFKYQLFDTPLADCLRAATTGAIAGWPLHLGSDGDDDTDSFSSHHRACLRDRGKPPVNVTEASWCGLPTMNEMATAEGNLLKGDAISANLPFKFGFAHVVFSIASNRYAFHVLRTSSSQVFKAWLRP